MKKIDNVCLARNKVRLLVDQSPVVRIRCYSILADNKCGVYAFRCPVKITSPRGRGILKKKTSSFRTGRTGENKENNKEGIDEKNRHRLSGSKHSATFR